MYDITHCSRDAITCIYRGQIFPQIYMLVKCLSESSPVVNRVHIAVFVTEATVVMTDAISQHVIPWAETGVSLGNN